MRLSFRCLTTNMFRHSLPMDFYARRLIEQLAECLYNKKHLITFTQERNVMGDTELIAEINIIPPSLEDHLRSDMTLVERNNMRTAYTIQILADIDEKNIQQQRAFETILRDNAQVLYSQSVMMSRSTPQITVAVANEIEGYQTLDLFETTPGSN